MRLLALVLLLASCSRPPLQDPEKAFLPSAPPALADAFPLESLRDALRKTLAAYKTSSTIPAVFHFAGRAVTREQYRRALEALLPELESFERFHAYVLAHFDFYEVYGADAPGEVFSTGYYEPRLEGSRRPTARFTEPLYRTPPDMVAIDVRAFAERFPDLKPLQDLVLEQKSRAPILRGRLEGAKVLPFYDRAEIQRARVLAGRHLEIAYVNPIDAFFLEIQGSGTVALEKGQKLRVGYDAQNGYPYVPVGKFLWDVIPKDQMSMQRIRRYLEPLSRERQQDLFDKNPSYVFFREVRFGGVTYSGAEVTPMRTIASDQGLFPKGTLGFLDIELPVFADASALDPSGWRAVPHWVFDQDTGGAIRGGGRIDQYIGDGAEAERIAGVLKRKGRYWVVAPKE